MAKTVTCDRCHSKIENGGNTLKYSFNGEEYDLCQACFILFKEFMSGKALQP